MCIRDRYENTSGYTVEDVTIDTPQTVTPVTIPAKMGLHIDFKKYLPYAGIALLAFGLWYYMRHLRHEGEE